MIFYFDILFQLYFPSFGILKCLFVNEASLGIKNSNVTETQFLPPISGWATVRQHLVLLHSAPIRRPIALRPFYVFSLFAAWKRKTARFSSFLLFLSSFLQEKYPHQKNESSFFSSLFTWSSLFMSPSFFLLYFDHLPFFI